MRHGHESGEVTLGGRRVAVGRPRARSADGQAELSLATYAHFAARDPPTEADVSSRNSDRHTEADTTAAHRPPISVSHLLERPSEKLLSLTPECGSAGGVGDTERDPAVSATPHCRLSAVVFRVPRAPLTSNSVMNFFHRCADRSPTPSPPIARRAAPIIMRILQQLLFPPVVLARVRTGELLQCSRYLVT